MHSSDHNAGNGMHSRKRAIVLVLLAKFTLVAGLLVLAKLGMGYIEVGTWTAALHGLVLAAVVVVALWGGLRHKAFGGGGAHGAAYRGIGIVLHRALVYDLLVRALTFGRENRFREAMLCLANLWPGESVLDVACGTGTLAIAAKRQVGPSGRVAGVDASAEMIERARAKAGRASLDLNFVNATAQALPFGDAQFDIVIGTLMLHHLSKPVRSEFVREAGRVLKPGGRLLLIDFGGPGRRSHWLPRLHRHGHIDMRAIAALLSEHRFKVEDIGAVGTTNLNYIRATPGKGGQV
ncbi:class I SAM-dependent methyltransferase [Mesorhizobium qingshengii]|uniref:Demethylmenaquinone methyltransferase / 2-methoxy-6-polyprenyl-1,4-benzoquinol methylase n=1 Tax=Mesorhizobium qingshengii TaxID=1165689 RepID=A0A1G5WIJ3_9HYPH|nr:methyltransferase domain-containing protein [Mesorhizobium qingshengii]SDA58008.1 demethylmenaquinone methyltransferase / 2-methoxy-6-polyprenyl-1,4-benzoquinol methylase [Mesorhizobium qingshengii]